MLSFKRRFIIFYAWTAFLYLGYMFTNQNQFFTPHYLPLTFVDQAIPFYLWSIVPYFILILGLYLPIAVTDQKIFYQSLDAIAFAVCINYTIFFFFPTIILRPQVPIDDTWISQLYHHFIAFDSPANCFPSGHITSPFLGVYFFCKQSPKKSLLFYSLFFIFSISVLTTKQHYLLDIFGGLTTAMIGIMLSKKVSIFQKKNSSSSLSES